MKRIPSILIALFGLVVGIPSSPVIAEDVRRLLPEAVKDPLGDAAALLREFWSRHVGVEEFASFKGKFDAIMTQVGSDEDLLEAQNSLEPHEGRDFLIKLAMIALEMNAHPDRIQEIGEKYVYGPSTEAEKFEYFGAGVIDGIEIWPQVLRPRVVSPEDRIEENRLAMEYYLIAPGVDGIHDAVPQLLKAGVLQIKNPKSILTFDVMAGLSLPSRMTHRMDFASACLVALTMWPRPDTFRVLARHLVRLGENVDWESIINRSVRNGLVDERWKSEWSAIASAFAEDDDQLLRQFANEVQKLHDYKPPEFDGKNPFESDLR